MGPEAGLTVRPEEVVVEPGEEVVFVCSDSEGQWSREGGAELPGGARQGGGVLTLPRLQPQQSGFYICSAGGRRARARLSVTGTRHSTRL